MTGLSPSPSAVPPGTVHIVDDDDPRMSEAGGALRFREEALLESGALERHMPEGVRWTRPQGGLFLWATLPEGIDTSEILRLALEENVAFVPGTSFYANGGGENTMRLNFSNAQPRQIFEGIKRLGKVLEYALGETEALVTA